MKPMPGLTDNTVLAKVNGQDVKVKEINGYLQGTKKDFRIKLQDLPAQHVKQFVEEYTDVLAFYPSAKEMEKTEAYKAAAKKLAVELWITKKFNSIKVSEKEIKDFYNKNKSKFVSPMQLKASHILVKTKQEAIKLIQELKKAKNVKATFTKLAKKYSVGPSGVNGGELGWFNAKQMVPEFVNACKELKPGEITLKPVKTRFGYHVILVEAKNDKNYMPLNEVKLQIIEYLKRAKLQKEIQKIKDSSKVDIKVK